MLKKFFILFSNSFWQFFHQIHSKEPYESIKKQSSSDRIHYVEQLLEGID
jgi:hypothetical protein